MSDVEHFFHVSVGNLDVFFGEVSFHVFGPFLHWIICVWVLSLISSLYILDTNLLSDMSFENIFYPISCLLVLLIVSFAVQKLFILMRFQ